jgi:hypothetical protein
VRNAPGGTGSHCPNASCRPVRQLSDPALAAYPTTSFQQWRVRYGSSTAEGSDLDNGELYKWSSTVALTHDSGSVTKRAMHRAHPESARSQCPKARCRPVRQLSAPALAAHPTTSFQQWWVRYGSSSTEGSDHATGELYKWSDTVILSYNSDSVTNRVMYQVHPEGAHSQ